MGSWWLKLHQVSTEFDAVGLTVFVLLGLLDLSLLLGEILQLLLVLLISLHLGLVLHSVLLDQLLLGFLFLAHVFLLERHGLAFDDLGTLHEDGVVVTGESVLLLIDLDVA